MGKRERDGEHSSGGRGMGEEEGGMGEEGRVIEWEVTIVLRPPWGRESTKLTACFPTSVRQKILAEDPASTVAFIHLLTK